MFSYERIVNNIKELRRTFNLSQFAFGNKLSLKQSMIADIESGKTKPSLAFLNSITEKFNIPLDVIVYKNLQIDSLDVDKDDNNFISIKYFDEVQASAGAGAFNETELFSSYPMPAGIDINPQHDVIINVIGDSMSPTLNNSDKVLINTALVEKLVIDNIYAIITDGTLFVKRYSGVLNDAHVFSSDNKTYSNIYLKQNDDKNIVVGLVKRIVDRKLQ